MAIGKRVSCVTLSQGVKIGELGEKFHLIYVYISPTYGANMWRGGESHNIHLRYICVS